MYDFSQEPELHAILESNIDNPDGLELELHKQAQKYLEDGQVINAWKVLLQRDYIWIFIFNFQHLEL